LTDLKAFLLRFSLKLFIFRYNGAKGILLKVDDDAFRRFGQSKKIALRESNVKFKTTSIEFGCVRESKNPGDLLVHAGGCLEKPSAFKRGLRNCIYPSTKSFRYCRWAYGL